MSLDKANHLTIKTRQTTSDEKDSKIKNQIRMERTKKVELQHCVSTLTV